MKVKEKIKLIRLDPFNVNIWIVITSSVKQSANHAFKLIGGEGVGIEDDDDSKGAVTVSAPHNGNIYIVISPDAPVGHIAHECYHAANAAATFSGVEDEEFYAYTIGFLTEKIFNLVNKKKAGK